MKKIIIITIALITIFAFTGCKENKPVGTIYCSTINNLTAENLEFSDKVKKLPYKNLEIVNQDKAPLKHCINWDKPDGGKYTATTYFLYSETDVTNKQAEKISKGYGLSNAYNIEGFPPITETIHTKKHKTTYEISLPKVPVITSEDGIIYVITEITK